MNLSIKNVPDEVVQRLRERAARRHRSLQGELLAIIEQAVRSEQALSASELLAEIHGLGLRTPAGAAEIVRADRDRRREPSKREVLRAAFRLAERLQVETVSGTMRRS